MFLLFLSPTVTLPCCLHAFTLKHVGNPTPCRLRVEEWAFLSHIHCGLGCPSVRFVTERKQKKIALWWDVKCSKSGRFIVEAGESLLQPVKRQKGKYCCLTVLPVQARISPH